MILFFNFYFYIYLFHIFFYFVASCVVPDCSKKITKEDDIMIDTIALTNLQSVARSLPHHLPHPPVSMLTIKNTNSITKS